MPQVREAFMPRDLPMIIQPMPWRRYDQGGHLALRTTVMRVRGTKLQHRKLVEADELADLHGERGLTEVGSRLSILAGVIFWLIYMG